MFGEISQVTTMTQLPGCADGCYEGVVVAFSVSRGEGPDEGWGEHQPPAG